MGVYHLAHLPAQRAREPSLPQEKPESLVSDKSLQRPAFLNALPMERSVVLRQLGHPCRFFPRLLYFFVIIIIRRRRNGGMSSLAHYTEGMWGSRIGTDQLDPTLNLCFQMREKGIYRALLVLSAGPVGWVLACSRR